MKCPKCSHLNEDYALYCNNCGTALAEKKKDWTSILLLAWCVSMIFFAIVWSLYQLLGAWLYSQYDIETANKMAVTIQTIISTIQLFTHFVIPVAIPKKTLKIISFIIIVIVTIWHLVQNFRHLMMLYQ